MKATQNHSNTELAEAINAGRPTRSPRKRIIVIASVLLLGIALWVALGKRAQANPGGPSFVTQEIKRGDIRLTVTATGNLEPTNEVSVGSELSGTTVEVYVDSNDSVEKGQVLARLDTRTLENQLKASRAALESAKARLTQSKATLKEAEATLARQQELQRISDGRIPSKADLAATEAAAERARADVLSAQAAISEAEADVETRENDLSKASIVSPIDGVVLSRSIEPGQTVASSFSTPELFVIAEDLSEMKLEVAVAEADIGLVASGQSAQFAVDAWSDRSFAAKVLKVAYGSEVTDNVVTYSTELSVGNEDLSLRPGMTATADIDVAYHENVLLVPISALRFNPTPPDAEGMGPSSAASGEKKSFLDSLLPRPSRPGSRMGNRGEDPVDLDSGASKIWILEGGRPRPVEVSIGLSDGRFVEAISEELSEGTLVITAENQNV
ncbi:efflux RND transporter periplasmic adaptor subunit [Pelagicoccus sp. SDUM812005]|uniref:efflux RND transporter periplasmic adaptor subunit n=1 Tax=Pelagicoccus sp. SDUM812005 TaxID=3041257 RepID=UPI00280E63B9|nr:efflux RND transporter periplasmic adaptor subunit [Pelagicoccus sp. SDUM812005]MDQ8182143.1 efflux RND transporter periplasmic adaptor subunit [Pelagicoccus sp. SDUM812005]